MSSVKVILIISIISLLIACSSPTGTKETVLLTPSDTTSTNKYTQTKTIVSPSASGTNKSQKIPSTGYPSGTTMATQTKIPKTKIVQYTPTYDPDSWQIAPVVPVIQDHIMEIYQRGIRLGNDPHAFSKIGDCGSTPTWFLGDFDRGPRFYILGKYQELQNVIDYYQGSFDRISLAAQSGFNASSVLTPLWADKSQCQSNETPLACEYRIHKPIIAFITLGANDVYHLNTFEPQMRKIIEYSINHGVIPILSTKPDNIEKNQQINQTIARLALEYQLPLWNYWKAMQPLPNHGLQEDGVHITFRANNFNNVEDMQAGWPVRNLTALQVLDAMWHFINLHLDTQ
jgi:hypothetical protein